MIIRLNDLFADDGFDMDRTVCKVIYDLWLIQESSAGGTIVPVVRVYCCKVKTSSVVEAGPIKALVQIQVLA